MVTPEYVWHRKKYIGVIIFGLALFLKINKIPITPNPAIASFVLYLLMVLGVLLIVGEVVAKRRSRWR